jgi:Kef-type K+ transport system membrane component KefB/mannitol/fructose-specific phosphotransferase system IIA component (Ntr-type)
MADPLLTLSLVLVSGLAAGRIAQRFRVPSVTGQILVGIALGPSALGVFGLEPIHSLQPITRFALGLIAVTIGSHLHLTRILVAKRRLFALLVLESLVTPALVIAVVGGAMGARWEVAVLLATLAVSTAPATVVALVREARAQGVFVRTLMAAVALNNIACLALFEVAFGAVRASMSGQSPDGFDLVLGPLLRLLMSFAVGAAVGLGLIAATRRMFRTDSLTTASLVSILLTVAVAREVNASPLLACLALGLTLANVTPDKEEIGHRVFRNFETAILAVFFTMAGAELDFATVVPGGMLALAMVAARMVGKVASARAAMRVAGAPQTLGHHLGWALIPQAGVAVGLLLLIQDTPELEPINSLMLAVGLTAVTLNELIGPVTTRWALQRSGEVGKDRARVIDFLAEENILTDLRADSMPEALEQLSAKLWSTHRLDPEQQRAFTDQILAREAEMSSYLGDGLAIPHGEVGDASRILGVMGISAAGVPTKDPQEADRVHCIVLLASPFQKRDHHLQVLAAFARAISSDRNIRGQLYEAESPAHAYQLLHSGDADDFNHFLDDDPYQTR